MSDHWPKYIRTVAVPDGDQPPPIRQITEGVGNHLKWLRTVVDGKFESPIEERMGGSLYAAFRDLLESDPSLVSVQARVGQYRADFLIRLQPNPTSPWVGIVVECDGKEFHTDAAKDRRRDEWMLKHHYWVFRFTGSDIYRAGRLCADRVRKFHDDCQQSRVSNG